MLPRVTFLSGFSSSLMSPLQPNPSPPAAFKAPNTPTASPPALAFLSSGGAIRLETTTKRPIMVSPFVLRYLLLLLVSDVRYPLPDAGHICQTPFGFSVTRPNLHGDPSGLIHYTKPGLIGQVIPKKNGRPAPERRRCHKRGDRSPFIDPFRFKLHDAFTRLQRQLRMRLRDPGGERKHGLFMLRCLAIVQGKGHPFGFQLRARQFSQCSSELRLQLFD